MPNLIGTGNNQIPTNGMLGGLAYQSPDNAVIKTLELTNLAGHNSLIPSTAVDVFVYDTRKDSDGGQWRKRTQHLSWYNETLNTATRGSRRDFPCVAVIVATANDLTIYDADDPDMPMWMVFLRDATADKRYLTNSRTNNAIFALNGQIAIADSVDTNVIKFISDTEDLYGSGGLYSPRASIVDRNNTNVVNFVITDSTKLILAGTCNDIAMTVLPNAPIDTATGLPVPTIAISTSIGVSVILDNGNVVTYNDAGGGASAKIAFTQDGKIAFAHEGATSIRIDSIRYTNYSYGSSKISKGNSEEFYINSSLPSSGWSGDVPRLLPSSYLLLGQIVANKDNILNQSSSIGLNFLARDFPTSPANNRVAYVSNSYNTGWMLGDIKGAWLSDTTTGTITGTELVTNGTFGTDVSGWTAYTANGGSIAWQTGGYLRISNADTTDPPVFAYQAITTVVGQRYILAAQKVAGTNFTIFIANSIAATPTNISSAPSWTAVETGYKYVDFVATATTSYIILRVNINSIATVDVDNVSLRIVDQDRSVTTSGLVLTGTITKSTVNSNSNLVAYSGFNASNYLVRPAGVTDLNTSNITFMSWYKGGTYASEEIIVSTGDYLTAGAVRSIYLTGSGVPGFAGWGNDFNPGVSIRDNIWHFICVTVQYVSGTTYNISVYIDGQLTGSTSKGLVTFTNTAIDVGGGTVPGTRYVNGSISLVRVSTTLPTAEQVRKIYEDEKVLFQPNSQCTLYGSSSSVSSIAFDETTKLLHAGTSSGRSVFQGLERVDYTTTAVSTAISASNSLVAEQ